jgi:hypothetical protein
VQWVLTSTDSGSGTRRLVVISPYEAAWAKSCFERLDGDSAPVTLHAYLPPLQPLVPIDGGARDLHRPSRRRRTAGASGTSVAAEFVSGATLPAGLWGVCETVSETCPNRGNRTSHLVPSLNLTF